MDNFFDRHLFYNHIKDRFDNHHKLRHRALHRLEMLLYLFYALRFTYIMLSFMEFSQFPLSRYDFFTYEFQAMSTDKDYLYSVTYIMLLINSIFLEHSLYFSRDDTLTWQLLYDVILRETQLYEQCLRSKKHQAQILDRKSGKIREKLSKNWFIPQFVLNLICSLGARISIYANQDYLNKQQLSQHKLKLFSKLSIDHRIRMHLVLEMAEMVNFVIITLANVAIIALSSYYFVQLYSKFPIWYLPVVVLDLALSTYLFIRMMQMFAWIFCLSTYTSLIYIGHLNEANAYLRDCVAQIRKHPNRVPGGVLLLKLKHFLLVNTTLTKYLTYTNDEVWASATGILFCCQMPGNIYVIYRSMDESLVGSKVVHNWIILSNQLGMLLGAMLSLARTSKAFHAGHIHIPPLVAALGRRMIILKLKYSSIYERLNSEKAIGISIGPFDAITYKMVFEIFLIYIAYVFFFFDLFVD